MTPEVLRTSAAHVLVSGASMGEPVLALDDDEAHHLCRVLRLRPGAAVTATDGRGTWVPAALAVDHGGQAELRVTGEPQRGEPASALELAVTIPKGDRLDWMVQKVTELGAARLVLLHADHSVVRWPPERIDRHLARAQRVADEALRQSRRTRRLVVAPPIAAADYLADDEAPAPVIAEPGGRRLSADDQRVVVGPEGGWSERELASGRDTVDLGPTILRTETAAVAVAARCVAISR
ncbi:MAG: RsmE family RNA methyltransferase [Actinomycetota bacterium]